MNQYKRETQVKHMYLYVHTTKRGKKMTEPKPLRTLDLSSEMKRGPVYFVDWAHTKPCVWFDVKLMKIVDEPEKIEKCTICGENFPEYLIRKWKYGKEEDEEGKKKKKDKEVHVYTIHPNKIANYRKRLGEEKTDENDARLIAMYAITKYAKDEENNFRRDFGEPPLRAYYRTFKQIQKVRISAGQRQWAKYGENGHKEEFLDSLKEAEDTINKNLKKELKDIPIHNAWLQHIKGCGPSISAGLLSEIEVENFKTPSSVHKWFGLDVVNGKPPKLTKGKTLTFSPKRRALVIGILGDQFIRNKKSFYRTIYDNEKQRQLDKTFPVGELASKYDGYKKEDTHLSKGHIHNRAIRKAVKLFLSHYWHVSRILVGLPTRVPYPIEYLGHTTIIEPPYMDKVQEYIDKNQ